jgi:hypothetical protein
VYGGGVATEGMTGAAVPSSTDWWRPTRGLATWLTGLLALQAVASFAIPFVVDQAPRYVKWHRALDALIDGHDQEASRIYRSANTGTNSWSLVGVVTTAVLVVSIIWMWRSAHNSRALGRTGARLAPGWAIASWFIPLGNFVLPYLLYSDLWRSSDPATSRGDGWRALPGATVVRVFWAAHVLSSVLVFGATGLAISGTIGESATRAGLIAGGVAGATAALLNIVVVRTITDRQEAQQAADPAPTSRPLARQFVAPTTADGPGWYADPSRHYDHRYWDGSGWTEHVSKGGVASIAPVTPPDWYPDPTGRFHWRYWTGHEWTEHVSRDQELFVDPLDGDAP